LDKDAMAIAILEDSPILRPMDTGENAIQLLQVIVIMVDPIPSFIY
jgi:hypothetical protein